MEITIQYLHLQYVFICILKKIQTLRIADLKFTTVDNVIPPRYDEQFSVTHIHETMSVGKH